MAFHINKEELNETLVQAASHGNFDIVKTYLEYGADVNYRDQKGKTPLHFAAENGHANICSLLLIYRAKLDLTDFQGRTPLYSAIANKRKDIVSELINRGSNVRVKDANGRTPLHCAVINNTKDIVSKLLRSGSDPTVVDKNGCTPLHFAVVNKNDDIESELLNRGSDPNVADINGTTPLQRAVDNLRTHNVVELLKRGADTRVVDKKGRTPLHCAVINKSKDIAFELLQSGSDPNVVDLNGCTPLHYAVKAGIQKMVSELLKCGTDPMVPNKDGKTAFDFASSEIKILLTEHTMKVKLLQELRGMGLENVADLQELLHESFHKSYWNRVYLVGPYSVGKSCLAKVLVGDIIPPVRKSTDGIWIYMGRAGMNVDSMKWVFFPKGNAITEVLTHMLMSLSSAETSRRESMISAANLDETNEIPKDRHSSIYDAPEATINPTDIHVEKIDTNKVVYLHHKQESPETADIRFDGDVVSKDNDQPGYTAVNSPTNNDSNQPFDDKGNTGERPNKTTTSNQQAKRSSNINTKKKERKKTHQKKINNTFAAYGVEISTQRTDQNSPQLENTQEKKETAPVGAENPERSEHAELMTEITSNMSHDKIHELIVKAVKEGKYKQKIVPIDIWDFGGQKDYYMTHQLFITSRGIFVLMFNGSIDLHKHMPDLDFLPGHFGKPTVAVYLLHWVNSILTYCRRIKDEFPKIVFVATHKDKKWFEFTQEARRKQLEYELQDLFETHAGLNHLEFQPLLFVDATNPADPEIKELRRRLMQRATEHPRWGEPMPTKWIPLELLLAQKSEDGINIISRAELMILNSKNDSMVLSEKQIETFLKVQHSLGKLLYFDVENLREFIIISPAYLVDVLKSIITEKQFWPTGERFSNILKTLQESGMIELNDIHYLWEQEAFNHILLHKDYMIQILVHLDVIIAPRTSLQDDHSTLQDVSFFLVPCMITKPNDTMFLKRFWQSKNSIILAYTFHEEVIPPALSYRFLSSFITSWDIKNYKERGIEKRMLFSDLAVVNVDNCHDVAVQVKTNRLIVSLIHAKTKEDIIPTLASSLQECLTAAIVRISEFYSTLSEDIKSADVNSDIPFNIEFGVFCNSDICFVNHKEMPLSTDDSVWVCKKHKQRHATKGLTTWFSEKEPIDECTSSCKWLGRLEREQCPLPQHVRRLASLLSPDECRETSILLGFQLQEWKDLEYQFLHQPPNDIKFMALWSCIVKSGNISFDILRDVLENKGISSHLLCQVFRDVTIDALDMTEETLNKIPSVDVLLDLSNHIGNSTMQLAIELEVDLSYIQQIQHDHKNKLIEQTRKILMKWRQNKFPRPTIMRLLKALYRVGKFGPTYQIIKNYL